MLTVFEAPDVIVGGNTGRHSLEDFFTKSLKNFRVLSEGVKEERKEPSSL